MSLRQIFNRLTRFARSYSSDDDARVSRDDLRRAEELIEEAANRWELGEERREDAKKEGAKEEGAKRGDAKQGDGKQRDGGDAKQGDAKQGDAKQGDAKQGDAKQGDAKQGDAKQGDAKQGDAKQGDAKQGDARGAGAKGEPAGGPGEAMTYERALSILEVKAGASAEEVTRSYRRLVLLHHPDRRSRGTPEEKRAAEERTRELNRAYTFLKGRQGSP